MIRFLFLGLLRDRNRSLLPVLVVTIGVMLTVVFHSWLTGVIGDSIEFNARFSTGHVKVMTSAYADNIDQMPNDLAIINSRQLCDTLRSDFPSIEWIERIHFAGLIDVPDQQGETRAQGNAIGFGVDMLTPGSGEIDRMNIRKSLVKGHLPQKHGEILLSDDLTSKLGIKPGDAVSLISSTMYGEMAIYNFTLAGTVAFGTTALDRGTVIADIGDVQNALNMEDAAGEIIGLSRGGFFDENAVKQACNQFNAKYHNKTDEFSPVMISLKDQNSMGYLVDFSSKLLGIMIFVFLLAMSIVLWNAGLLGGLRRYGEFGMRIAIGEEKRHVYLTMIYESLLIGIIGSLAGVGVGILISLFLEKYGINFGSIMKNATIIMPTVFKARITPVTWFIGFIPGILSTLIGTMLSGIGIYKRQTAQLFKELEA